MSQPAFKTKEDCIAYIDSLSMAQIKKWLVYFFMEQPRTPKIVMTEEQFNAIFKIKGRTEKGEVETRGRRPKKEE